MLIISKCLGCKSEQLSNWFHYGLATFFSPEPQVLGLYPHCLSDLIHKGIMTKYMYMKVVNRSFKASTFILRLLF